MRNGNRYSCKEIVDIINLDINYELKKELLTQNSNLQQLRFNNQNMLQIAIKKHYKFLYA